MKKSDLLSLIASDDMRPALEIAQESAVLMEKPDLQHDMVLLRSQWENLEKEEQSGTIAWDVLLQNRNKVKRSLLGLLDSLPEQLPVTRDVAGHARPLAAKPGVTETRFKRQVFFFMLAAKCWIIFWILFHKSVGGFTSGEAMATSLLLLPVFALYMTVMLRGRRRLKLPDAFIPRVNDTLKWITWAVFIFYVLALHWIVGEKASGDLADNAKSSYENMVGSLAVAECMLGIYVGYIIHAVFKGQD